MCWKIVQQSEKRTETKSELGQAGPGRARRSQAGKKSVKQRESSHFAPPIVATTYSLMLMG